jgi:hypothetical protein
MWEIPQDVNRVAMTYLKLSIDRLSVFTPPGRMVLGCSKRNLKDIW